MPQRWKGGWHGRRDAGDSDYRHRGKDGQGMGGLMTKIPWTNETINPWVGCTKCAAGCLHCYAEKMAWRLKCMGKPAYQEVLDDNHKWNGNIVRQAGQIEKVLGWRKPRRIFWGSMTDIFHPKVPFEWIDEMMAVIALTPQHTHQILTKRIERAAEYFGKEYLPKRAENVSKQMQIIKRNPYFYLQDCCIDDKVSLVLPNLWLGTSISTQADADKNIPILLQTPAAVRFISLEPMLEMIQDACHGFPRPQIPFDRRMIYGWFWEELDQVIIGCESGPKRRPCKLEWIEYAVNQCDEANVPVFVKQIEIGGKVSHNPKEWPKWARRQEYPK